MQPFIAQAREPEDEEASSPAPRRGKKGKRANNYPTYDRAEFKAWAEKNNVTVPERGRPKLADVLAFVSAK